MKPVIEPEPKKILEFWFADSSKSYWFERNEEFDRTIIERFVPWLEPASDGQYDAWQSNARGALALVLLFDQIPRNAFRGEPRSFAYDGKALQIADRALEQGYDRSLSNDERLFLYLPFEHSEDRKTQARCVTLMGQLGNDDYLDYARRHQVIIDRFGRFPHRNAILGRTSSEEELAFLKEPNSSF